ncbi:hypothetical protein GIS00_16380 [Nakamurella sp. YIM 132087]|uniref:Uncharacterized protein n=1 Tax=Nakamurella alba TaxID=2665158 RepID=A0A7K1FMW7_9ACTN|nr:hypothetical protein [Nakamurella alba]MTD15512.1 hypothetical protein [Nakamurella alba]
MNAAPTWVFLLIGAGLLLIAAPAMAWAAEYEGRQKPPPPDTERPFQITPAPLGAGRHYPQVGRTVGWVIAVGCALGGLGIIGYALLR